MVVTFDTNVLLSATLWDGSVSQKLLFALIRQEVKIYSSTLPLDFSNIAALDSNSAVQKYTLPVKSDGSTQFDFNGMHWVESKAGIKYDIRYGCTHVFGKTDCLEPLRAEFILEPK